eukprot:Hpha_TRINITY_DN16714_c0_g3::TRINITY_DN16714_c0_g3_i3::g.80670::m.80670
MEEEMMVARILRAAELGRVELERAVRVVVCRALKAEKELQASTHHIGTLSTLLRSPGPGPAVFGSLGDPVSGGSPPASPRVSPSRVRVEGCVAESVFRTEVQTPQSAVLAAVGRCRDLEVSTARLGLQRSVPPLTSALAHREYTMRAEILRTWHRAVGDLERTAASLAGEVVGRRVARTAAGLALSPAALSALGTALGVGADGAFPTTRSLSPAARGALGLANSPPRLSSPRGAPPLSPSEIARVTMGRSLSPGARRVTSPTRVPMPSPPLASPGAMVREALEEARRKRERGLWVAPPPVPPLPVPPQDAVVVAPTTPIRGTPDHLVLTPPVEEAKPPVRSPPPCRQTVTPQAPSQPPAVSPVEVSPVGEVEAALLTISSFRDPETSLQPQNSDSREFTVATDSHPESRRPASLPLSNPLQSTRNHLEAESQALSRRSSLQVDPASRRSSLLQSVSPLPSVGSDRGGELTTPAQPLQPGSRESLQPGGRESLNLVQPSGRDSLLARLSSTQLAPARTLPSAASAPAHPDPTAPPARRESSRLLSAQLLAGNRDSTNSVPILRVDPPSAEVDD